MDRRSFFKALVVLPFVPIKELIDALVSPGPASLPSAAVASSEVAAQLTALTRRAYLPKMVASIYESSPQLSGLLATGGVKLSEVTHAWNRTTEENSNKEE
jgi:hypothetical protein